MKDTGAFVYVVDDDASAGDSSLTILRQEPKLSREPLVSLGGDQVHSSIKFVVPASAGPCHRRLKAVLRARCSAA